MMYEIEVTNFQLFPGTVVISILALYSFGRRRAVPALAATVVGLKLPPQLVDSTKRIFLQKSCC